MLPQFVLENELVPALALNGPSALMKGFRAQAASLGFGIWHGDHVEMSGNIKLDPSKNPMEIDFEFQDGKREGKTDLAIYAWDGANLKLCWVRDGDKHPSEFATKPGDKCVLVILKRQDP